MMKNEQDKIPQFGEALAKVQKAHSLTIESGVMSGWVVYQTTARYESPHILAAFSSTADLMSALPALLGGGE
jgi:hypothetical protein